MTNDACREWRGSLGAAALGRLEPAEEIGLRAHLDGCAACRAELRELEAVGRALSAVPVTDVITAPAEPSGALANQVLDRLSRERRMRRSVRRRRAAFAAGVLAAAAAVVAILVLAVSGGGTAGTRVVMPGIGGAPATATLHARAAGTELDVHVSGLTPGGYYWFWVTGEDGHRIPAGTIQGSASPATVCMTAAVPLSEARRLWVTDSHGSIVLDAPVPRATSSQDLTPA